MRLGDTNLHGRFAMDPTAKLFAKAILQFESSVVTGDRPLHAAVQVLIFVISVDCMSMTSMTCDDMSTACR